MLCEECGPPLISALFLTLTHLGIYFTHSTVWLTAAEICEETQVFPNLNLLTNNIRLVLDMQIILPPWELQVHVAKDNGNLRDDYLTFSHVLHRIEIKRISQYL